MVLFICVIVLFRSMYFFGGYFVFWRLCFRDKEGVFGRWCNFGRLVGLS